MKGAETTSVVIASSAEPTNNGGGKCMWAFAEKGRSVITSSSASWNPNAQGGFHRERGK